MANALIIVDVQNYFLKDAPSDLPKKIINHINSISYDHIVLTKFKNTSDSNFVKLLKWDKCNTERDAELPEEFKTIATTENTFTRSYYSAFKSTQLHSYLQDKRVERLIICGVDTDACVLATAFDAFDLGYHLKINFDLTFSSNSLGDAAQSIAEKNLFSRD